MYVHYRFALALSYNVQSVMGKLSTEVKFVLLIQ